MPIDLQETLVSPRATKKTLAGFEMPVLGYGVYEVPDAVAEDGVEKALKAGYRHIDSARCYENETGCAAAIRKAGLKRSDVFLTTKLNPDDPGYEGAQRSIQESLKNAQTDYFDLILVHTPWGGKEGRLGAWRALVEAQKAGQARSIGVSNFGVHHLEELEEYISHGGGGRIEVGQYELHPWLARAELVDWLRERGAIVQAYSPLTRGTRLGDPILQALGKKHHRSPVQILIRWSLQMGFVPLPKTTTAERIAENADVFDFALDEDDMKLLHTGEYSPTDSLWDPTVERD
ncbi:hypothetical protein P175DRAFT_0530869 [Aspergillus ochraceoroseus IBT 24754]|uniref:D-xylose reductase [NAD(P)H] n=1 Tax=Aspergillus ochraceoroseus IBT 24754 TaxID=1392256 RepID=A0A2T5LYK8_9EURO|nr:uncharacterized protein P175DRAFT_0530869 [Aspergillus ochraceoroseus IBT 24754]PTU21374.1 hypothetical protein P175DRAFT_0530869 [Aspergillus ochraceoroseus IBT 24754]